MSPGDIKPSHCETIGQRPLNSLDSAVSSQAPHVTETKAYGPEFPKKISATFWEALRLEDK